MRAKLFCELLPFFIVLLLAGPASGQIRARATSGEARSLAPLRQFFADEWRFWVTQYPEFATQIGYPGQNARWADYSPEAVARRKQRLRTSLARLKRMDRTKLAPDERLNYGLYRKLLENALEGLRFHHDAAPFAGVVPNNLDRPINQMEGVPQEVGRVIAIMPKGNVQDYENIIARLEGVPRLVDQTIALMEEGLRRGNTPPRVTLRDVPKQVEDQIVADPMASPLLRAFGTFPAAMPEGERARLKQQAIAAYQQSFVPAFRKLHGFLVERYIPACRETIAASALPDGVANYAFNVRWQTTTNLTPQQIHEIGLAEVKRIRGEMENVIAATGFKGTFAEFLGFLRTDPRFYYTDPESLLAGYRDIAKRADPQLAPLFGKLPRLPYGVTPVPDYAAPSQTTAYYQPGSPAAGRAGQYFVNLYDLKARPKWEMEALTLHEAVPGHHLQISLAQELEGLPEFRKHLGYSAFVEGWALYAESLGEEMGFYQDPYTKFGQLTYQMWRAIRLVVDTGMHAMGWSRDQAMRFFAENAGKTERDIVVEVDRYIVWPGQALAYKIGELKIRELRAHAERELGPRFSLRAFHEEVLGEGAVPLDVLEARVKAWVARQKAARRARS